MPDEHDDLRRLLETVRLRDEGAARLFVARLGPLVLRIVRAHRLRRVQEEDLCQEVFMNVFRSLESYRSSAPLEHWVARIARNVCLKAARHERVRPELRWADLSDAEAALLEELHVREPVDEQEAHHAREVLARLLETLPAPERALIHWLEVEERGTAEVAARLGWSRVRVKVAAFRVRQRLRAALKRLLSKDSP
jgi:RNA polymerase sigma-70 factor (ECF subfamily)